MLKCKLADGKSLIVDSNFDSGVFKSFSCYIVENGEYSAQSLSELLSSEDIKSIEGCLAWSLYSILEGGIPKNKECIQEEEEVDTLVEVSHAEFKQHLDKFKNVESSCERDWCTDTHITHYTDDDKIIAKYTDNNYYGIVHYFIHKD